MSAAGALLRCASSPCGNGAVCRDLAAGGAPLSYCTANTSSGEFRCEATVHIQVQAFGHEVEWGIDDDYHFGPYPESVPAHLDHLDYYQDVNLSSAATNGTAHTFKHFDAGASLSTRQM